ncbi:hypothetical protein FSARC_10368 [Fusarium sarcochroum]|uniref:Major facilitator superfamily (MFS) profile domain-containing protein n=1 Tax=Fusarium sarcochroum TaxID=1208366 RepID=A0A8H4X4J2_9HYPO|nr:hypothetical protein FSARC_10368 [Fusarium sarcochroum]
MEPPSKQAGVVSTHPFPTSHIQDEPEMKPFKKRIREIFWDTLDRSPEERRMIAKLDFFILTWASLAYFSKNLNTNNLSNAYVSGMKEELPVVGNEYQTFTTMWTIGYVISQIPSQLICTRVRLSIWCPSWELFWVVVTFATAAVQTSHQLYACRFLVGLAEGTFYPAVHTVLGAWYTKRELAKRSCIFFATAFVGSMFSGYLQAALHNGMNGVHGLSGWRWLFIFDGVITLPMALWAYYALPDLPSNTRVKWLKPEEKEYFLHRMQKAGRDLEEPFTLKGLKRVTMKWHFWVYTTYYTFFICSENIGSYMNLWLKSLNRYSVAQVNTYPTVTNAVTIVTTIAYGWTSDALQIRAPIIYFSLFICFFAAMNLAIRDGVPFGLKWASFYLTGFAQGSGPIFFTMVNEMCAGDSLERKFILGTTNSIAYAFNAWIPLITYNTNYAPRFLVGNTTTVALIVGATITLTVATTLQKRDERFTFPASIPEAINKSKDPIIFFKFVYDLWIHDPRGLGLLNLALTEALEFNMRRLAIWEIDTAILRQLLLRLRRVIFIWHSRFRRWPLDQRTSRGRKALGSHRRDPWIPILGAIPTFSRHPDSRVVQTELSQLCVETGNPVRVVHGWLSLVAFLKIETPCNYSVALTSLDRQNELGVSSRKEALDLVKNEHIQWRDHVVTSRGRRPDEEWWYPGFWVFPIESLGPLPPLNPKPVRKNSVPWSFLWLETYIDLSKYKPELYLFDLWYLGSKGMPYAKLMNGELTVGG